MLFGQKQQNEHNDKNNFWPFDNIILNPTQGKPSIQSKWFLCWVHINFVVCCCTVLKSINFECILQLINFIIQCIFPFLFINWEPTMWLCNCLSVVVCSFVVWSKCVFAGNNILLMCNWNQALVWKMADCFPELWESGLNMKTNLVIK